VDKNKNYSITNRINIIIVLRIISYGSSKRDSSNSIARFYLKNIFIKNGNQVEAYKMIFQLIKYYPDVFPYLKSK